MRKFFTLLTALLAATQIFATIPAYFIPDKFGFGIGYRTSEELLAFLNLKIADQFTVGYAFDYSFAPLGSYTTGSHELMVVYRKETQKPQHRPRLNSPMF